jgi:hypothetical protein
MKLTKIIKWAKEKGFNGTISTNVTGETTIVIKGAHRLEFEVSYLKSSVRTSSRGRSGSPEGVYLKTTIDGKYPNARPMHYKTQQNIIDNMELSIRLIEEEEAFNLEQEQKLEKVLDWVYDNDYKAEAMEDGENKAFIIKINKRISIKVCVYKTEQLGMYGFQFQPMVDGEDEGFTRMGERTQDTLIARMERDLETLTRKYPVKVDGRSSGLEPDPEMKKRCSSYGSEKTTVYRVMDGGILIARVIVPKNPMSEYGSADVLYKDELVGGSIRSKGDYQVFNNTVNENPELTNYEKFFLLSNSVILRKALSNMEATNIAIEAKKTRERIEESKRSRNVMEELRKENDKLKRDFKVLENNYDTLYDQHKELKQHNDRLDDRAQELYDENASLKLKIEQLERYDSNKVMEKRRELEKVKERILDLLTYLKYNEGVALNIAMDRLEFTRDQRMKMNITINNSQIGYKHIVSDDRHRLRIALNYVHGKISEIESGICL